MRIVLFGLGNIGKEYRYTRHNLGHLFVDYFAQELNLDFRSGKGDYIYAQRDPFILVKNATFMNISGVAVKKFVDDFEIDIEKELFLCHDDLDMLPFNVKIKFNGGSGGHRGIESCVYYLGTEKFYRVKFGIGKPTDTDSKDYVLSQLTDNELKVYQESFKIAYDGISMMVSGGHHKGITYINSAGKRDGNRKP